MRLLLADSGGELWPPMTSPGLDTSRRMLFKGNSSRLELLIEKIQANKENHHVSDDEFKDALGTDPGSSWRSETPEDATSPSSCATPNSATDVADSELAFTVGVTEATPYACSFCDKAFPRLSYLKKHEQTHSDQMPFRCEYCSRLFKHKRSRDRHIKLHTGDKKYRCTQCEAAFSRSDHLKIHMKTHDNQKPFQCTVCNRGYNTAAALTSHMQNHKKAAADSTSNGGASNGRSSSRASSENTPSPGTFRCLQCGDCFRKPEELQTHMSMQHHVDMGSPPSRSASRGLLLDSPLPRSPFPLHGLACMYCTKDSFSSMEALQLHVHAMHGSLLNGELRELAARVRAPVDDSPRGSPLTPHLHPLASPSPSGALPPSGPPSGPNSAASSGGSGSLSCDLCTMRLPSLPGLHKHQRAVHGLSGSKIMDEPIVCIHCSQPFPSSAAFAEHYVLVHGGVAPSLSSMSVRTSPPSRDAEQPTDLSLGRKSSASSRRGEDRLGLPPSKRSKTSHSDVSQHRSSLDAREYDAGTLLCNQCGAALPDFEAFRAHLKAHLDEAGGLRSLLSADLLGLLPPAPPPLPGQDDPSVRSRVSPGGSLSGGLSCPHCGVQFPQLSGSPEERVALERHLAEHFLVTATEFGCPACAKLFAKPDELQKHLMDIHAQHLYRCALCQDLFDSKVAIQVHFAVKHSSACPLYRCTACPSGSTESVFRSERDFTIHIRSTHSTHPLLAAAHSVLMQQQQKQQQRDHRERERDQRDRDQRDSAQRDRDQRERDRDSKDRDREQRDRDQGAFRCLFCRSSFGSELELQFHLPTHTKQFHCPICQETFQVEFLLDKHLQSHHSSQVMNGRDTPSTGSVDSDRKPSKSSKSHQSGANGLTNPKTNGEAEAILNNNQAGVSCDICERGDFAGEAELAAHRKLAHHSGKGATGGSQCVLGSGANSSAGGSASAGTHSKNGAVSLHCAYCSENCKSRTELENHMKTHSQGSGGSGKHKCNICDELCPSAGVLAQHKLTHCKVVQGSACTVCRSAITSQDSFRAHLSQHSAQPGSPPSSQICLPTPCVICRQTLVSDVEVRLHARFHVQGVQTPDSTNSTHPLPGNSDGRNTAQCCLCLQTGDASSMIATSSAPAPGQAMTLVCKDCYRRHTKLPPPSPQSQQQSSPQNQNSPQRQDSPQHQQRCSECGIKVESAAALEAHMACSHKNTYQCIKCQASFESERDIRLHVSAHLLTEGSAANDCRLCRRLLSSPLQLQLHLIEHTFAGCASFTCYICSTVFTAARGLQAHMLEHGLAARPYDCSLCGLRFFFRAELDNHTLGHHPNIADDDDGTATQASFHQQLSSASLGTLDSHYYTTSSAPDGTQGSKSPRKSPGRSIRDNSRSGAKQRCLICNKDFPGSRALSAHLRSSHGVQGNGLEDLTLGLTPQVCIICKEIFQDRDSLLLHMAVQHPGAASLLQLDAHMALFNQAHSLYREESERSGIKQEVAVKEEVDGEDSVVESSVQDEERAEPSSSPVETTETREADSAEVSTTASAKVSEDLESDREAITTVSDEKDLSQEEDKNSEKITEGDVSENSIPAEA